MNYNTSTNNKDRFILRDRDENYALKNKDNNITMNTDEWILVPTNNKRNSYKTRKNYDNKIYQSNRNYRNNYSTYTSLPKNEERLSSYDDDIIFEKQKEQLNHSYCDTTYDYYEEFDESYNQNQELDQDQDQDKHDNYNNTYDNGSESYRKQKNDNYKKILCKNINNIGKCIYNNKCLYAHSLDEQNVEPIRKIAYDMIKNNENLSNIDLNKSKHLYNNLLALSKVCSHCEEGICTGGYNCKHGACDKMYVICQIDLNKGTCDNKCCKIHLTSKGLIPYGIRITKNLRTKSIPRPTIINNEFFKKLNHSIDFFNQMDLKPETYDCDNESVCSEGSTSDKILTSGIEIVTDEIFNEFNLDHVTKKEEKINRSIFKINF